MARVIWTNIGALLMRNQSNPEFLSTFNWNLTRVVIMLLPEDTITKEALSERRTTICHLLFYPLVEIWFISYLLLVIRSLSGNKKKKRKTKICLDVNMWLHGLEGRSARLSSWRYGFESNRACIVIILRLWKRTCYVSSYSQVKNDDSFSLFTICDQQNQ